ncbi:hypothetical protein NXW60_09845 [Bacteroides fragilis]|nr:hypothetical protein NXW60_09845 [Bacteroides fragilis]
MRQEGFSNIMALISGENEASIRLFEKCGFECCANIRQVAEKFGKKLDLKMYQKIISDNSHLTPTKADDRNTSTQEVLFKSESTIR